MKELKNHKSHTKMRLDIKQRYKRGRVSKGDSLIIPVLPAIPNDYNRTVEQTAGAALSNIFGTKDPLDGATIEPFQDYSQLIGDPAARGPNAIEFATSILHQLARDGNNTELEKALVQLGNQRQRRINQLDGDHLAPLHYAARYSHADTVTLLLEAGALPDVRSQEKLTPLHFATRYRKQFRGDVVNDDNNDNDNDKPPEDEGDDDDGNDIDEFENIGNEDKAEEEDEEEEEEKEEEEDCDDEDVQTDTLTVPNGLSRAPSILSEYNRDKSVVKQLVDKGAEINARDIYDLTPLHYAAMRGNDVAASHLLDYTCINIEARDKQLMTPLFIAATFGNLEIARQLLACGAKIDVMDETRQTPLHRAAAGGQLDIIKELLRAATQRTGVDKVQEMLSVRDMERQTPLHEAVNNGHLEVATRLIESGADVDSRKVTLATPLHAAAVVGNINLIELLLSHRAMVDSHDSSQQTPLHRAAAYNHSGAIAVLLRHGAKLDRSDKDSFTPLLLAASQGHSEAVQTLLDYDADITVVDKDDKTPIFWCAEHGYDDTLHILLKNEICLNMVDISDRYDNSPLHVAARMGFVRVVVVLLEAGSLIDNKNEDEETALHIAAEMGQTKVVRELVRRKRYMINDENEDSDTPLHLACSKGRDNAVNILLEAGADVEARNTKLWTPLDCASAAGHQSCCLLLIDNDAPLDPMDKTKTTPLQLAASNGHVEVIRLLLEHGANLAACDATGRNALELAIASGKRDVALAIIKSDKWDSAVRNIREDGKGRKITPLRLLIKKFPDVAEALLDKCTSTNGKEPEDKKFTLNFFFEIMDDTYNIKPSMTDVTSISTNTANISPFDHDGKLVSHAEPYTKNARELQDNHPLNLMVKYRRTNLLGHPVSVALVKHKWMMYGRFFYYFNLIFFTIFLGLLTGYVLLADDWQSVEDRFIDTGNYTYKDFIPHNYDTCKVLMNDPKIDISPYLFLEIAKWTIAVMALINLFREFLQMYQALSGSKMVRFVRNFKLQHKNTL